MCALFSSDAYATCACVMICMIVAAKMQKEEEHFETFCLGHDATAIQLKVYCVSRPKHNALCSSQNESFGTTCNTGLRVYDGSTVLAEFLNRPLSRALLRDLTVLELGCGCGLAGIVAARSARRVVFSDSQPACLSMVARSVKDNLGLEVNAAKVATQLFSWDDRDAGPALAAHQRYDCIVAAELAYFFVDFDALTSAIATLLTPEGCAFLCHVNRVPDGNSKLARAAEAHGLVMRSASPKTLARDARVDFVVLLKSDVRIPLCDELEWEQDKSSLREDGVDPFLDMEV